MINTTFCSFIVIVMTLTILGCGGIKMPQDSEAFYRVYEPDQRLRNQTHYFKGEYQKISERRGEKADRPITSKPEKLIGLGLSGGGIRSAAYQFGLLAGFQSTSSGDRTALDNIDYMSCVSGGCWAAGAFLISKKTANDFFACLNEQAEKGAVGDTIKCDDAKRILRIEQKLELAKTDKKEKWEEEIRDSYFDDQCREFSFSDKASPCWQHMTGKPRVIFNATHSTGSITRFGGNIDNLPFQITPDFLGTVVDCGSNGLGDKGCGLLKGEGAGENKIGFFVQHDATDFRWVRRERSLKSLGLLITCPGSQMSKAMAHASSVVGTPIALAFSMGVEYRGEFAENEIRDNYFLTDGGFTENLGLLALIERGTDLIVLSDMGYPEREGQDLNLAIEQVNKLMKCEVNGGHNLNSSNIIATMDYKCPNKQSGKIIYVRPLVKNIDKFREYLRNSNSELYNCIEDKSHHCYGKSPLKEVGSDLPLEENHQFPQTETMLTSYDERLIRAYYLLGKFIAQNNVLPEMRKWQGY